VTGGYAGDKMTADELVEKVESLSAEEQASVAQFIDYLERQYLSARTPFLQAAEEFIAEHPDLLQRLAQ
jgi:hypothetical protein